MSDERTLTVSLITALQPERLSKRFDLAADGTLLKTPGGQLIRGTYEKLSLGLTGLLSLLGELTPAQALTWGCNGHDTAMIVSQRDLTKYKDSDLPCIARDRAHFSWPQGAGVLLLDYDPKPGSRPMSKEQFLDCLYGVWPELRQCPHIWRPSASSCIYRQEDDAELRGIMGQRVWVPVQEAADIPRSGEALFKRLWLEGLGRYDISKSGALLSRSLIDAAVWQPERLDFAGGASCGKGLIQRRPEPEVLNLDAELIDTRTTLRDLDSSESASLAEMQRAAREALAGKVSEVRERWVSERLGTSLETLPPEERTAQRPHIEDMLRRAIEERRLLADFILHSEKHGPVTVGEVLDKPAKFHNTRFADPLEPDYGNDRRIAWCNLRVAGRPYIFSHAHGGNRYTLHRALQTIRLEAGELHHAVDRCLELAGLDGVIYDRGAELGRVSGSNIIPVTPDWLTVYLTRYVRFEKWDARRDEYVPADCPPKLAKAITAVRGEWRLPYLRSILTAPTITPEGRVIDTDGFDEATGIYLHFPDSLQWRPISSNISFPEARQAVQRIWRPFRDFPFVGEVDRGVMLSATLTAPIRPVLPTAPGFGMRAPTAGSGKTILAKCLSLLAGADSPAVLATGCDEPEMRKRLFALARDGVQVMILDNVEGTLESPSLCAYLTSETASDRILGASETTTVPSKALVLITGNNFVLAGDLNRRVLRAAIDPQLEAPYTRRFDLNPEFYVREHRLSLIRDIIIVLSAFKQHVSSEPLDSMASFEVWSDFIRQAVIWIGIQGWLAVDDPMKSIEASYKQDPDSTKLAALLAAWHSMFGRPGGTVAEAIEKAGVISTYNDRSTVEQREAKQALYDAMNEIAGERGVINPRRLGRWIEGREGRIQGGMRFERLGTRQHKVVWVSV